MMATIFWETYIRKVFCFYSSNKNSHGYRFEANQPLFVYRKLKIKILDSHLLFWVDNKATYLFFGSKLSREILASHKYIPPFYHLWMFSRTMSHFNGQTQTRNPFFAWGYPCKKLVIHHHWWPILQRISTSTMPVLDFIMKRKLNYSIDLNSAVPFVICPGVTMTNCYMSLH